MDEQGGTDKGGVGVMGISITDEGGITDKGGGTDKGGSTDEGGLTNRGSVTIEGGIGNVGENKGRRRAAIFYT